MKFFGGKKKSNKQQGGPPTHSVHRALESKFQKHLKKINHLKSQEKKVCPEKMDELQAEFNELKQGVSSYLQHYLLGLPSLELLDLQAAQLAKLADTFKKRVVYIPEVESQKQSSLACS